MTEKPSLPDPAEIGEIPRRGFLARAAAFLVGAFAGLIPLAASMVYFFDPITRRRKAVGATGDAIDKDGFIRITSQNALPADGSPRAFKVVADLQDFWNKFPNSEIGSVFLRREPANGEVVCLNSRCPHLGCTVSYDGAEQHFFCPCHESAFDVEGKRANDVPPRDMDPLECKVDADGMVLVKFMKFRAGIKDRKPI